MRTAETILADLETSTLKAKLLEYPALIHQKKEDLLRVRQQLTEAQNARTEAEALLVSMIAAEINPNTGKPAYSNAEARAAELVNRKKQNTEYQQAEKVCRDLEARVNSLQFDLERLQDEFRAYRYVVDLTTRELALLASDIQNGGNGEEKQPY